MRTDIKPIWCDALKVNYSTQMEKLAGFLAFHATGHNACIDHERKSNFDLHRSLMSYMSEAECIIQGYLGNAGLNCPCPSASNAYYTLESFVRETMMTAHFDEEIKEKIYDRYIK